MPTIYRADADRVTIAEAKRLIVEALPKEDAVDIYATVDEDGKADFAHGPVEVRQVTNASIYAAYMDGDFSDVCQQLGITPRWKYRPTIADYKGDSSQDGFYSITHDEFVKYAGLFGVAVVVGKPPSDAERTPEGARVVCPSETKEQRQDRRLQACIDARLPMNTKAALSRLPDGVGDVADAEGVTRQAFSTDVKAALKRRANAAREGSPI